MNRDELKQVLENENFKQNAYSLVGGGPDEALCLSFEEGSWLVYYSERGLRTDEMRFETEPEACEYFLEKLRADPTTKRGWNSGFQIQPK